MHFGIGTDIIEIERIKQSIDKFSDRFLDKMFTPKEQQYCLLYKESERQFAGRFAAKEAILKALGTGLSESIAWTDVEILNDEKGKPYVCLHQEIKERSGNPHIIVSISHCKAYATASALAIFV